MQKTPLNPPESLRTIELVDKIDRGRKIFEYLAQLHQAVFILLWPEDDVRLLKQLTLADLITELQVRTLKAEAEAEHLRQKAEREAGYRRKLAQAGETDAEIRRKAGKRKALERFITK